MLLGMSQLHTEEGLLKLTVLQLTEAAKRMNVSDVSKLKKRQIVDRILQEQQLNHKACATDLTASQGAFKFSQLYLAFVHSTIVLHALARLQQLVRTLPISIDTIQIWKVARWMGHYAQRFHAQKPYLIYALLVFELLRHIFIPLPLLWHLKTMFLDWPRDGCFWLSHVMMTTIMTSWDPQVRSHALLFSPQQTSLNCHRFMPNYFSIRAVFRPGTCQWNPIPVQFTLISLIQTTLQASWHLQCGTSTKLEASRNSRTPCS